MDGLADDLDAALSLNSSWIAFKGTLGTLDEYCLSVESLPLLLLSLLLLSSWYLSISLSSLSLDEED